MTNVFAHTTHPDERLFHQHTDPKDPRLGEIVHSNRAAYDPAQVVIIGVPEDEGVKRRGVRVGTAEAPNAIRSWLYQLSISNLRDDPDFSLFDLGDIRRKNSLEETHTTLQTLATQILADGKTLIVLGGGGDIAYPNFQALQSQGGEVLAFNVDAHFDVRDELRISCGTAYRQLMEGGHLLPDNYYSMGYQIVANSPVYADYMREKGAHLHSLNELRDTGVVESFRRIMSDVSADTVFWDFDLDSVRACDAPGVSAPMPLGLTGEELCNLSLLAGSDPRTRLVQYVEVNPKYDLEGRTSHLTAVAIFYFLSGVVRRG